MTEIALVAAIVALIRKHLPKIDGLWLVPVTIAASLLVVYREKLQAVMPPEVWAAGSLTVAAMGGVSLLSYFAGKLPMGLGDLVVPEETKVTTTSTTIVEPEKKS